MKLLDAALTSLLLLTPLAHLLLAPYTKVEESFNMQAAHDILVYGTPSAGSLDDIAARIAAAYDHATFPGAVPRTFVGAVCLAGIAQPVVAAVGFARAQLVVRGVLGLFNAGSLLVFRSAVQGAFGAGVARWWVVLLVSQFHVQFYLSRTLPNMFAFGLTTLAFAFMLPKPDARTAFVRAKQAVGLLTLAAAIFRSEAAILLATCGLYMLYTGRLGLRTLIPVFLGSFIAALALSVPVDSYFWRKPLWPELWGFYYNVVLGASSDWGVSPWHYYFTSALPRLLLNPLAIPLIALSLYLPGTASQAKLLTVPSLLFLAIYSLQPHKEARFIFYVVPPLTAAAALGANFISTRRGKSVFYAAGTLALALSVLATLAGSAVMLLLSSLNYPGGEALAQLRALTYDDPVHTVSVHADVLTCMTGLTLFGQNPAGLPLAYGATASAAAQGSPLILVDKTENQPRLNWPSYWKGFDYALAEDPTTVRGDFEVLGVVQGFAGIEMLTPSSAGEQTEMEASKGFAGESNVLGRGAVVAAVRDWVRRYTGGWWIGPRMAPRIRIMKRVKKLA